MILSVYEGLGGEAVRGEKLRTGLSYMNFKQRLQVAQPHLRLGSQLVLILLGRSLRRSYQIDI